MNPLFSSSLFLLALFCVMLKQANHHFNDFSRPRFPGINPPEFANPAAKIVESDEFRMYAFKIKRCAKTRVHDWTECAYAHRSEKARRRDPRKFNYAGVACPEFRQGSCPRGESCEFAHGVFEFWLHPARYRTRACKAGRCCQRKVCFFAHTPEQLRSGTKYMCENVYGAGSSVDESEDGEMVRVESPPAEKMEKELSFMGEWDLFEGMRGLKIADECYGASFGAEILDFPDVDWVWELIK